MKINHKQYAKTYIVGGTTEFKVSDMTKLDNDILDKIKKGELTMYNLDDLIHKRNSLVKELNAPLHVDVCCEIQQEIEELDKLISDLLPIKEYKSQVKEVI